jgi:uncharacterized protein (TIGR03067 family)
MGWRTLGLAVVLTLALRHGPPPDAAPAAADLARLQGVWTMAENIVNGMPAPEVETRTWLLVVEDDVYNPGSGETSLEYRFRLDPTRTPKAIDLFPQMPFADRTKYFRGIYTVVGDTLVVCRPIDLDDERPAGFGARAGSNLTRVVWKRRKAP